MEHNLEKPALRPAGAPARRPVRMDAGIVVRSAPLYPGRSLPLAITPVLENADLATWAASNTDVIGQQLQKHGGILFRGFKIREQADFERFLDALKLERMHYLEGATPRSELGNRVYTSTQFPAEHAIALHNELSYAAVWPMKIAFCCLVPAETGGETPIADVRGVFQSIDPEVRQRFIDTQWTLARNFGDGLSLPWQSVFRTDDKAEVERYCRDSKIGWEWKTGDRLRTRQVRPAAASHPRSGEMVWFNHIAFWHYSTLDPETRAMLVSEYTEEGLPYNTYYGDGAVIEESVVQELRRAYDSETVRFPWQQGDVLLLDNMLVAQGRAPYTGRRKVIVAMGEPITRHDL